MTATLDARPDSPVTTASEAASARSSSGWARRAGPLVALCGAAIVITLLSHYLIYPAFSWNRDEITYFWQVEGLRNGHVFLPDGGHPEFFWPWLTGLRNGAFFSQYTLGWPVVILVSEVLFGSPLLSIVFASLLAVTGTYLFTRELIGDRVLALVSAALMTASPLMVIQSGVFLPYLFSLGVGLFFGAALLAGLRRNSRQLLFAAGVLLGWLQITRSFDAVLWLLPLSAYAVVLFWRRWRRLWRGACYGGLGCAPFLAAALLYNRRISGSFMTFPLTAKEPLDGLGFGQRRLMPTAGIIDYTIGRAADSVLNNMREVPPFLFGGWVALGFAVIGLWIRRRDRANLALLFVVAAFPVGYFFFWGNFLSVEYADLSGPVYYIPLYVPLCVLVAASLLALWRRSRRAAVAAGVVLAMATIPTLVSVVRVNHRISRAQQPWQYVDERIPGRSLVFVASAGDYLLHLNPYSANAPDLQGQITYAVDRGPANIALIGENSERVPYLARTSDPAWGNPIEYRDAPPPRISLVRLEVLTGTTLTLRMRVTNPGTGPATAAFLHIGDRVVERRMLSTSAQASEVLETEWTFAPPGSPDVTNGSAIALTEPLADIRVGVGFGATPQRALAGRQLLEQYSYRLDRDRGTIDVLHPGRTFTAERQQGELVVTEVARLPNLDVELTLNR